RRIQSSILPKNSTYGKLKLSGIYDPSDDVSGDLYDMIKIDENRSAFYIADVMGHGVKASIMTMFLKVTMSAIFDKHPDYSPSEAFLNHDANPIYTIRRSNEGAGEAVGIIECIGAYLT